MSLAAMQLLQYHLFEQSTLQSNCVMATYGSLTSLIWTNTAKIPADCGITRLRMFFFSVNTDQQWHSGLNLSTVYTHRLAINTSNNVWSAISSPLCLYPLPFATSACNWSLGRHISSNCIPKNNWDLMLAKRKSISSGLETGLLL